MNVEGCLSNCALGRKVFLIIRIVNYDYKIFYRLIDSNGLSGDVWVLVVFVVRGSKNKKVVDKGVVHKDNLDKLCLSGIYKEGNDYVFIMNDVLNVTQV